MTREVGRAPSPRQLLDWATGAAGVFSGLAMASLMIGITADVVVRNVRGRGFPGVLEMSEVVVVILVMSGLAYTQRQRGHVMTEVLGRYLPPRLRIGLHAAAMVGVLAVLGWMVWAAWPVAQTSMATGEYRIGLAQVPLWPGRLAVPIGVALLILQVIADLIKDYRRLSDREPRQDAAVAPPDGLADRDNT